MKKINELAKKETRPVKIIQFGEGNFLRAFVDWMIHKLNEKNLFNGSVTVIQPIENGLVDVLNDQNGLFTLLTRGIKNGENTYETTIIKSINNGINPYKSFESFIDLAKNPDIEFIISNTTEAGIAFDNSCDFKDKPASSYPGKLTQLLYERFIFFDGDKDKGLTIIPCELIDRNGDKLKETVLEYIELWNLSNEFKNWILNSNRFLVTLVDRIVTGYPRNEIEAITNKLNYIDNLIDTCEPFHLWVIEGAMDLFDSLPLDKASLEVVLTDDIKPYRDRKVKILNGAHTMTVLGAYLYGYETVDECMKDKYIRKHMECGVLSEVASTLSLTSNEINSFANSVFERFENPYLHHRLLDISLNSFSKFKTRVLPSFLDYYNKYNKLPKTLTLSFAMLLSFYKGEYIDDEFKGTRGNDTYKINDNKEILDLMNYYYNDDTKSREEKLKVILSNKALWETDLSLMEGFYETTKTHLENIERLGMKKYIEEIYNV